MGSHPTQIHAKPVQQGAIVVCLGSERDRDRGRETEGERQRERDTGRERDKVPKQVNALYTTKTMSKYYEFLTETIIIQKRYLYV